MRHVPWIAAMVGLVGACGGEHPEPGGGAERPAPSPEVGASCSSNPGACVERCVGANDDIGDSFPGGFCTRSCFSQTCPDGTVCVDKDGDRELNDGVCLYPCAEEEDCALVGRPGFHCMPRRDFEASTFYVCIGKP